MKYAHLLQAFYAEPWHLRPDYWRNFDAVLQRALSGQEVSPVFPIDRTAVRSIAVQQFSREDRPVVGPVDENGDPLVPQMEVVGPLAVIPVHGVLGRRLSLLDLWCGACDYAHISAFTQLASNDPEIVAVIYDMNSPGGMSAGCMECAEVIAALGQTKPTLAFTDGMICSAAYWLASQCGEIWAAPTAQVGNVGTILAGEDTSEQWKQEGRKLELFTSSPLKATGLDGKPWTDADRAYMTERMLQCDHRIKNAVRAGRGTVGPRMSEGLPDSALDGRYFFADKAPGAPGQSGLDVGMVDRIAPDLDAVITELLEVRV